VATLKSKATFDAQTDVAKTVRAWAEEAHAAAVTQLYGKLRPAVTFFVAAVASDCHDAAPVLKGKTWLLNQTVTDSSFSLMEEQLVKAGVRLAALLNTI
jgi:hypothetical protein